MVRSQNILHGIPSILLENLHPNKKTLYQKCTKTDTCATLPFNIIPFHFSIGWSHGSNPHLIASPKNFCFRLKIAVMKETGSFTFSGSFNTSRPENGPLVLVFKGLVQFMRWARLRLVYEGVADTFDDQLLNLYVHLKSPKHISAQFFL